MKIYNEDVRVSEDEGKEKSWLNRAKQLQADQSCCSYICCGVAGEWIEKVECKQASSDKQQDSSRCLCSV